MTVHIPTPLRRFTGGLPTVAVDGETVGELLDNLERAHPGIKAHVCDERGRVRRFVSVFANDEDVCDLQTPLRDGDQITLAPSLAA